MLRKLLTLLSLIVIAAILGSVGFAWVLWHYGSGLPDHSFLKDYKPPVVTRVQAGDGQLVAEYATEKRVFVPIEAIPDLVRNAFLSAEDKGFYEHKGIEPKSILRAAGTNLLAKMRGNDRRPVGASTITQQVAKNFLLSNEVSIERKIKEAILALRLEKALTKDRILELYLNEIYLGGGAYGVAAAALYYFDKPLDDLTPEEAAFLAALPKAPNNYNPDRHPDEALSRRNWVLDRMQEDGHLTAAQAQQARSHALTVVKSADTKLVDAPYFAEEVRRWLADNFGESGLYGGGLFVHATVEPGLQAIANKALKAGLLAYDRRHGWRGPVARLGLLSDWKERLAEIPVPAGTAGWRLAVVTKVEDKAAWLGFADGGQGVIPLEELTWARRHIDEDHEGPKINRAGDVLGQGDVVLAESLDDVKRPNFFGLRQVPAVSGAAVAIDPHTGRVLAMSGGWSFAASEFNRATQALRQPGSAFKPFVYLTALGQGFTPSSLVLDAPLVIDQGAGLGKWRPSNYTDKFYGPTPLRVGIEKSRNVMTVRLAQHIGIDKIARMGERFGIADHIPDQLSVALGAQETTLLKLTAAYAMLVNGGRRLEPTFVDRVQDRRGRTVWRHDRRACPGCDQFTWSGQPVPAIADIRPRIVDEVEAYQMVSMLEGVVQRGTGAAIGRRIDKPLAGKTGTTNESRDTWFIGFAPDLAVGVFVGFDDPKPMGKHETGASAAVPIFAEIMEAALKDKPGTPFRVPPGVSLVRVDPATGQPAGPDNRHAIWEAFRRGTEPVWNAPQSVLGNEFGLAGETGEMPGGAMPVLPAITGTGGIY